MIRRSFRVGLTLGLLAGMALAVAKLLEARRADDASPDPWAPLEPVSRPAAPVPASVASPPAPPPPPPAPTRPATASEPPPPAPAAPTPAGASDDHEEADDHEELVNEVTHAVDEPPVPAGTKPEPARRRPVSPRKDAAARRGPAKKAPPKKAPKPWVDPAGDGSCPTSHPVKAKLTSKIFHLPGMLNYERTNPDRCYRSPETAEKDGLRQSKR